MIDSERERVVACGQLGLLLGNFEILVVANSGHCRKFDIFDAMHRWVQFLFAR